MSSVATSILATDFNESTIEQAKKKQFGSAMVSFRQADAFRVDQIEGVFDGIFAVDWFAHVPRSRILDFIGSVVARVPSGCPVFFLDQLAGAHSLTGVFDEEGNHIQERSLSDGSSFGVIKNFFSDEELEGFFSEHEGALEIVRMESCRRIGVVFRERS